MLEQFSLSVAESLYQSESFFPVDLDLAWKWLGYKEKRNALQTVKSNFEEGSDFLCNRTKSPSDGGRPSDKYCLSLDCFKCLAMMAGTEQGKQVRIYFLECEKVAKEKSKPKSPAEMFADSAQVFLDHERRLSVLERLSTDARSSLQELPAATVEAEPLTTQFALGRLVRGYAHQKRAGCREASCLQTEEERRRERF